ncbi:MAG: hypothetical protein O2904_00790 [bacterium]|nr:hypothetical protein [bacterium]
MVLHLHDSEVVTSDELLAREIENEMEWVEFLLKYDLDAAEKIAAAHEMITCGNEKSLKPWQCVMEFMKRNKTDAERILRDPVIIMLRADFEDRFQKLFDFQTGRNRDVVDAFDKRIHVHAKEVTTGIHCFRHLVNENLVGASQLTLQEAELRVESRVTSTIYEQATDFAKANPRIVSGIVITSYSPIVDSNGNIDTENKKPLGFVVAGPGFAKHLGFPEEMAA